MTTHPKACPILPSLIENRLEIGLVAQEAISVVPDGFAALSELVVVRAIRAPSLCQLL